MITTVLAHAGEEHSTESEGFMHLLKTDGIKILAISLLCIAIAVVVAKAGHKSAGKKHNTQESTKEETKEED